MSQFDLGGIGGMLASFQQKMDEMKRRSAETEVTGVAGGGLVKVTLTCDYEIKGVQITAEAMSDRELLEDLVRGAIAEAIRQAKEEAAKNVSQLAGGLPLPPGLL